MGFISESQSSAIVKLRSGQEFSDTGRNCRNTIDLGGLRGLLTCFFLNHSNQILAQPSVKSSAQNLKTVFPRSHISIHSLISIISSSVSTQVCCLNTRVLSALPILIGLHIFLFLNCLRNSETSSRLLTYSPSEIFPNL